MARIGVFGGTFDPPHRGHLAVAAAALEACALDRVLFVPTGRQPLKATPPRASYDDRCNMVALLTAEHSGLELSRADAPHPDGSPNFTADLVRALQAGAVSDDRFLLLVGIDSFRSLAQWHDAAFLARNCEWIVVSRPGIDLAGTLAEVQAQLDIPPAKVHALGDVHVDVSATDLRERLVLDAPCADALTPSVLAYIQQHNLYSSA